MEFEWNDAKADANLKTHGVSFELAKRVFKDPFAVERLDDREEYGEELRRFRRLWIPATRMQVDGGPEMWHRQHAVKPDLEVRRRPGRLPHQGRVRIISARRATQYEQDDYFQQNG